MNGYDRGPKTGDRHERAAAAIEISGLSLRALRLCASILFFSRQERQARQGRKEKIFCFAPTARKNTPSFLAIFASLREKRWFEVRGSRFEVKTGDRGRKTGTNAPQAATA
ncbi:MAG TPA: hypothetical protein VNN77_09525 [candidate division Zixibacteria bacterium]|nr:hypothetical protein [candidate division Zixibacteria bacterium]